MWAPAATGWRPSWGERRRGRAVPTTGASLAAFPSQVAEVRANRTVKRGVTERTGPPNAPRHMMLGWRPRQAPRLLFPGAVRDCAGRRQARCSPARCPPIARTDAMPRPRAAFTLIELLVVV